MDFYGLYVSAYLESKDGIVDLWLAGGAASVGGKSTWHGSDRGKSQGIIDPAWVTEIGLTIGMAMNSKVTVTLNPPFEEGLALISSNLLRWADGHIKVCIGYTTGGHEQTYTFGGLLQKPDVKIGTDITITLNGLGVGWALNLSKPAHPMKFEGYSPAAAVFEILKSCGNAIDISQLYSSFSPKETGAGRKYEDNMDYRDLSHGSIPFFQIPKKPVAVPAKGKQKSNTVMQTLAIDQGVKSDWWFISDVVKKFGMDLLVTGDGAAGGRQGVSKVVVVHPAKWRKDQSVMTFKLRGEINSESKVYPILEFDSPSDWVWLNPMLSLAYVRDMGLDKKVNQINVEVATEANSSPDQLQTGGTAAAATVTTEPAKMTQGSDPSVWNPDYSGAAGKPISGAHQFPGSADEVTAQHAKAQLENAFYAHGVEVNVTSVGIPGLLPGQVVTIAGIHKTLRAGEKLNDGEAKFDADYGVLQVEHKIGNSGFTTKFNAINSWLPKSQQVGGIAQPGGGEQSPGALDLVFSPSGGNVKRDVTA